MGIIDHEEWRPMVGHEKSYLISNKGKVKTIERWIETSIGRTRIPEKIVKGVVKNGYRLFQIRENGSRKGYYVHREVFKSFVGEIGKNTVINHIDGDKLNNTVENLENVSQMRNIRHAMELGLMNNSGVNNGMAKLNEYQVLVIRNMKEDYSYSEIANLFNVSKECIGRVCRNETYRPIT